MKRYKVILNPTAGAGKGSKAKEEIEAQFRKLELDFDLVCSEYPGHAIELARQAASNDFDVVVAVGGDGTVNEVVNGLIQANGDTVTMPKLGVVCVGRGNDFAGSLGIPEQISSGCKAIAAGQQFKIDIGRVRGEELPEWRYFVNCVGVGFDAITTIEVKKQPRWGGFLGFLIGVLKTVFLYNHAPIADIQFDEHKLTQRSLLISIMNGRRLGGGFYMAPDSSPCDGLLDLCIARQMASLRILRMIPYFMKGTQATQPEITTGQARQIAIRAHEGPIPAQTDGEIISVQGKWLEVEVIPDRLEIIVQPLESVESNGT